MEYYFVYLKLISRKHSYSNFWHNSLFNIISHKIIHSSLFIVSLYIALRGSPYPSYGWTQSSMVCRSWWCAQFYGTDRLSTISMNSIASNTSRDEDTASMVNVLVVDLAEHMRPIARWACWRGVCTAWLLCHSATSLIFSLPTIRARVLGRFDRSEEVSSFRSVDDAASLVLSLR